MFAFLGLGGLGDGQLHQLNLMDQPMELVIKVLGDKLELDVILGLDIDVTLELDDNLKFDVALELDDNLKFGVIPGLDIDVILELDDKLELE